MPVVLFFLVGCSGGDEPDPLAPSPDTAPPDTASPDTSPPGDSGEPVDSGEPGDTGDTGEEVESEPLEVAHFSEIGQEIIGALDYFGGAFQSTWGYGSDATFSTGWLLQTPADHWGASGTEIEAELTCTDSDCDPDFQLRYCTEDADCIDGGRCQEVLATVTVPGEQPAMMCVGHADFLYDEMYLALTEAESFADVSSLSEPDGRFLAAFRNAVSYLDAAGSEARIRVLFGHIPGLPLDTDTVLSRLTRDIASDAGLTVHVGAYRIGYTSWNHSKIVAADGRVLLQGGHNLWTVDYLNAAPVHDLSMRLDGSAALDAHRFLDRLWEYTCDDVWLSGLTERSVYPSSVDDCPTPYAASYPPQLTDDGVRTISAGRLGDIGENAADEAILAAIGSAKSSVKLSLQDIGPIRVAGDVSLSDWPEDVMRELAYVMSNDVDVFMVLSTPSSTPGGGSNSYGNGWTATEVVQQLEWWLEQNPWILPEGETAYDLLCEHFHVAPLRYFADEAAWPSGAGIGNHSKFFIVDDGLFYVGSQNLYIANLAEFGLFVDDVTMTDEVLGAFWNPLWDASSVGAVSGWQAASCTF
ncbi:MAG: hypothetical protein P8R54_26470 [Myxococcota bacterium]|nr:hypothetical protein [Myxococcota bacterium]